MVTSQEGINLIKKYEGLRLEAYKALPTEKYYTIGYGHYGSDVKAGDAIAVEQAEDLLKQDLEKFERAVEKYNSQYNWSQCQFDALVSFSYNCGIGNLDKLVAFGTRSIQEITDKIPAYNKAGGKVLNGLTKRRNAEQLLFISGSNNNKYVLGNYEITASSLRVRTGAGTNYPQKPKEQLTIDGQKHSTNTGALIKGTIITVKNIITTSNGVWGLIPSGYIALELNNNIYVKYVDSKSNISSIKEYSLVKNGNDKLSDNFTVKEFRCKDGSDKILIDNNLVEILQNIRNHFNKPVSINSAYRTVEHNKKVGGSSKSYHLKGMAADIVVSGVKPLEVAKYAENIGVLGIGLYDTFTHVDTRTTKSFWYSNKCVKRTTFN